MKKIGCPDLAVYCAHHQQQVDFAFIVLVVHREGV